jgi:hypothetical protein
MRPLIHLMQCWAWLWIDLLRGERDKNYWRLLGRNNRNN